MKNIKRLARSDGANAFIPEPGTKTGPAPDDMAEYLGENFVSSATGAEDADDLMQDDIDIEALRGPAFETDASATFGDDDDLEKDVAAEPSQAHSETASGAARPGRGRTPPAVPSPSGPKPRRGQR